MAGTSLGAKFLLANGITISKLREEILKAIGRRELREVPTGFPPLDASTQRVLDWAADEKLKSGNFPFSLLNFFFFKCLNAS